MKHTITVIPIGPGNPELLTLQAAELLRSGKPVWLRTERHPVSVWLNAQKISYSSLDEVYDHADSFEEMNVSIVRTLMNAAETGDLLYAVPDPVSDRTVRLLLQEAGQNGLKISVLPGVSVADSCLSACTALTDHLEILSVPASDFPDIRWNPNVSLLVTELDSRLLAGEVKQKINQYLDDEEEVFLFSPSGEILRKVSHIPLCQLDRQKKYDQTTALFVAGRDFLHRNQFCIEDLEEIMRRLRAQDGCPWDRAQNHDSLKPYMVEEAWEAVDAIDRKDMDHLADELGDVLLQVVFHASIGASFDEFTMTDVLSDICRKMIHRHPHIFTGAVTLPSDPMPVDSVTDWERIKRLETGSKTIGDSLDDVSSSLPSLKYAVKICKKMAQLPAFQQGTDEIMREISGAASSLLDGEKLNKEAMVRMLILSMELCRKLEVDGEVLLHEGVNRLKQCYQQAEKDLLLDGKLPEEMDLRLLKNCMARLVKDEE